MEGIDNLLDNVMGISQLDNVLVAGDNEHRRVMEKMRIVVVVAFYFFSALTNQSHIFGLPGKSS